MAEKKKKRRQKKEIEEDNPEIEQKPQPPNIFLYIQLAAVKSLPTTINKFEIHIEQSDSTIVKCQDKYDTNGTIYQEEFTTRPTFTLIIQQDNMEKINQVSDNPLLVKLIMRVPIAHPPSAEEEESSVENSLEEEKSTLEDDKPASATVHSQISQESTEGDHEEFYLELLSVGYIDLLKLFSKRRTMVKEYLYLYPVPPTPTELRITTHTEWHLYTLLPLIKEITMCNLAFVTLESIYNIKENFNLQNEEISMELLFRSAVPNEKNQYHEIHFCSFYKLDQVTIGQQRVYHIFECFRQMDFFLPFGMNGLNSTIEVEMHRLFSNLIRSEGLEIDLEFIDTIFDEVFMANSFHRYVLTQDMSNVLVDAIGCNQYKLVLEVWKRTEPQYKVLEGLLDPSVLLYPKVRSARFAVELHYVVPKQKLKKRNTIVSLFSTRSGRSRRGSQYPRMPTFAIIRVCLFAPLGEVHENLKVFTGSYVIENRLQYCEAPLKEPQVMSISEIIADSYNRLDKWVQDTISFIIAKKVRSVDEKKPQLCCAMQNLNNTLLKVIGADYNNRIKTETNKDFVELCAIVYNELEHRFHSIVEKQNDENFSDSVVNYKANSEVVIDYMNTIKYLYAIGDDKFAEFLSSKIGMQVKTPDVSLLYKVIDLMERHEHKEARKVLDNQANEMHASNTYLTGLIRIYLDHIDYKNNEETTKDATEFLLRDLTKFSDRYAKQADGWILLYCLYKQHNYFPGMAYARWHYEDYFTSPQQTRTMTPFSLLGIYNSHSPDYETEQGDIFAEVVLVFARLGLWEFAKVVYSEIQHLCTEAEQYMSLQNLAVLSRDTTSNIPIRTFTFEGEDEELLKAYNAQTNGNVEYFRENFEEAKNYYIRSSFVQQGESERDFFLLSKLRLAYLSFKDGDYQTTIRVLSQPIAGELISLVVTYLIARSYYRLDKLDEALEHFAKCTEFDLHIPDVWGYLAVINMRLGKTHNALECWKYAKDDPTKVISDEIYDELDKIDVDKVDLYIDLPASFYICN